MLATSSRTALKRAHKHVTVCTSQLCELRQCRKPQLSNSMQRRHTSTGPPESERPGPSLDTPPSPGTSLRHGPWLFQPDSTFKGSTPINALAQHNLRLSQLAESGRVVDAFKVCSQMKEHGVQPNITSYNWVLEACAAAALPLEAWAIVDDMISMGIKPNRTSFHQLIKANRFLHEDEMWYILDKMSESRIEPSAATFALIIERTRRLNNLELTLQIYAEMQTRGFPPDLNTARGVIMMAASKGHPRLALDLAAQFEESSVRRLDAEVWMNCLASSAESLYAEGVLKCWEIVVHDLKITPVEGLCIEVLHTAARRGMPDLATEVLHALTLMEVSLAEYHFAPIVEAFCRAGNIKDAFAVLQLMRTNRIDPLPSTSFPIFEEIRKDIDTLDSSYAILEKARDEGQAVDATALDLIIRAAVHLGDLQRAIGVYAAFPEFKVQPTIHTLNNLLAGCVAAGHRALGDKLISEMTKEAKIKPDMKTYEQMIFLCLTQETYEDAFFYLEEMKAVGLLPTVEIYEGLIKKCVTMADDRYKIALHEMKECGHSPSARLMQFIANQGNSNPVTAS